MNTRYPLSNAADLPTQDEPLTLKALWKMVHRRRLLVLCVTVGLLGSAIAYCALCTRQYKSTAEIQIQSESPEALGLGAMAAGENNNSMSDVIDATRAIQTQAKILESETLALEVVKELGLQHQQDFQPHFDPIGTLLNYVTPKGVPDPPTESLDQAPGRRETVYKIFKKNTTVKPIGGTRLIDVSYISSDPKVAAAAVNKLIDDLVDYNFETRLKASSQASAWIGKQLSDLRGDSERLQAQAAEMQGQSGVYSFGDVTSKTGAGYNTVLDELQQATANLTQAETNRVLRGALYEAAKNGDPAMIAGISNSLAANGQTSSISGSLSLIQTLRDQEATAKAQLSETAAKFGPEYPKLEEMRANVASLEQSIRDERDRLQSQTLSEYQVAQQFESEMRRNFEQQKSAAQALNNKAVEYEIVHQEADESRSLYEHLLNRLKEAGVLEGMRPSNISVVEPGRVPARPAKPNVPVYLGGALFVGLCVGVMLALLLEVTDSKVRDAEVISDYHGSGLVAELPLERRKQPRTKSLLLPAQGSIFTLADPASPFSEALRSLRTSILLTMQPQEHRVILVTSSISAEGKTTLAVNLATSLTQQGKRVLLVDADLRQPRLHHLFDISNAFGLATILANEGKAADFMSSLQPVREVPGLMVLTAGSSSTYPSELLGSMRMQQLIAVCRSHFDFVILDGEPILPVSDSIVLTPIADQVLLLARHGITERSMFQKSLRIVMSSNPRAMLGVVVNAIKAHANDAERYQNTYIKVPVRLPVMGGM